MNTKPKLLVIGDFACTTGFGTVNEELLTRLKKFDAYTIYVLGINAAGDPHPLQADFMIYPAATWGGDTFGVQRLVNIAPEIKPDLVFVHQDSWNVGAYCDVLDMLPKAERPPVIAWCPADAKNQWRAQALTGRVDLMLAPTEFGRTALVDAGFRGPTDVLPYGVDTEMFRPGSKTDARQAMKFPDKWKDSFIIGRADRNAARKRYDLTIEYFCRWWKDEGEPDVRLLLHCAESDPPGWNLQQLANYFGLGKERLIFTDLNLDPRYLLPRPMLANIYRSWDIHWSLTHGEGFGLTAMESAACGIPQVLPRSAAYGDLFTMPGLESDAAQFMEPSYHHIVPGSVNTVGEVVGYDEAAVALSSTYYHPDWRSALSKSALKVATNPAFNWDTITQRFHAYCQEILNGR